MAASHRPLSRSAFAKALLIVTLLLASQAPPHAPAPDSAPGGEGTTPPSSISDAALPEPALPDVVPGAPDPARLGEAGPETPEIPEPAGAGTAEDLLPSSPLPTATKRRSDPNWLGYLNGYRASAGLPALEENAELSAGAAAHSRYTVKTDQLAHSETSSNPFYTRQGDVAARSGNVMASSNATLTDENAIDLWMRGPFHALGILDPRLSSTGFGSYREAGSGHGMAATLDVLQGRKSSASGVTYPVKWPAEGLRVPIGMYTGSEYPDPLSSCPGYSPPTGLPLILQLGSGDLTPRVTASSFKDHTGQSLEHCVFDERTYRNGADRSGQTLGRKILGSRDAIVLIPRQPLEHGEKYAASITANGKTYTWSFSIGPFGAP